MPHYLYQVSELGKHDCVPYLLRVYRNIIITSSRYNIMCTCVWVNLMMIVYSRSVHVCGQSIIMSHSFAVCKGTPFHPKLPSGSQSSHKIITIGDSPVTKNPSPLLPTPSTVTCSRPLLLALFHK